MKRLCAWCKAELGGQGHEETHGVCPSCRETLLPVFLDTIDEPALLLDHDLRGLSANTLARGALRKDLPEIPSRLLGDLIDCRHAKEPGGCGKTPDCAGCALRGAIERTLRSGAEEIRVAAAIRREDGDLPLVISTRKVKEGVLVRIQS